MADQQDLDAHYTTMDKIFRLSLGEKGGYSGARFDGDFSLTLEQAQERKHKFIMDHCNIKPGIRCSTSVAAGAPSSISSTRRGAHHRCRARRRARPIACRKNGLNVHHMDSKEITPETFGMFDAVCAMGSPEHLCSVEEYRAGKQEEIYRTYFKQVSDLLPVGGRFYCQTMVFGPNMVKFEDIKFGQTNVWKNRKSYSGEELMDLVCDVFPGSWLPYGQGGHGSSPRKEHFKLIHRIVVAWTTSRPSHRWTAAFNKFDLEKYGLYATLLAEVVQHAISASGCVATRSPRTCRCSSARSSSTTVWCSRR